MTGSTKPVAGYRLLLCYLGTPYAGWQRQVGKETVQGCIEAALQKIWDHPISLQGSGRTDTGVHAKGQIASFNAEGRHSPEVLVRALNANLPTSIRILQARIVSPEFHARFDAKGKTYEYLIRNHPIEDPFALNLCWHIPRPLDVPAMRRAMKCLVGKHDFASFTSNPGYERETTVRTVRSFQLIQKKEMLLFRITADGFLYRMVRNLVGGLVQVGRGKIPETEIKKILAAKKRSAAPATAPAHGLYMVKVYY